MPHELNERLEVFKDAEYANAPHFTGRHIGEHMIAQCGASATVLCPAYYIQNDLRQKDGLLGAEIYATPMGRKGISIVDTRDIAELLMRCCQQDGAATADELGRLTALPGQAPRSYRDFAMAAAKQSDREKALAFRLSRRLSN